jgi:serine phosphatase RsbU (regulator of sigma subunit)/anti-sigma regulatory factor (Ser/Thr protein kinase)
MFTQIRKSWQALTGRSEPQKIQAAPAAPEELPQAQTLEFAIAPNDPLMAYFLSTPGLVEITKLEMDSPALVSLKEAGVKISVPLVSQGELIGLLNLGARRSEQEYSADDRHLLQTLATQAAPALRVAQLARQQQAEARERERMEQELRVARIIQQTLLPKELPDLPGWKVAAHWQPASAVSGDFYDFVTFPDGKLGIFAGDVTDKGVPAALVMATTRTILRAAAERFSSPGRILAQANDLLCPDIPQNMFVTCLCIVLDPSNGFLRIANAGHNLPYQCTAGGVLEMRATGMPLGLLPGMKYEEAQLELQAGESLLIYSDGLVEAHNDQREMFGFPRLRACLPCAPNSGWRGNVTLIEYLLDELASFTGPSWEQEDDVTFVTLDRLPLPVAGEDMPLEGKKVVSESWQTLGEFNLPSEPGNEITAMNLVTEIVRDIDLEPVRLERLKTAVAEATMNAMEHGNRYQDDLAVEIQVLLSPTRLAVHITDHGGENPIPEPEAPDLEAKLAGLQSPRGWGLFLIKNMVDEVNIHVGDREHGGVHHTVELILNLKGNDHGSTPV